MFKDLSDAKYIALDIETYDPDLREKGAGVRRNGYILGVSLATDTGFRAYFPLAHPNSVNLNRQQVVDYLNVELSRLHQIKLGANIIYDLDYLHSYGIHVKGAIYDVQLAEPLIDENRHTYSLSSLAQKYLGEDKKIDWLADRCKELKLKGDPRAHLWKFTADEVAAYAIGDVDLPLRIFAKQKEILKQEDLTQVFLLETRLIPLLLQMKVTGCRIDVPASNHLHDTIQYRRNKLKRLLEEKNIDPTTSHAGRKSIAGYLTGQGIDVPYTKKTNQPSVTSPYLKTVDNEIVKWLVEYRHLEKLSTTFLESQILGTLVKDRIHAQFNQLRADTSGTVTGRFSSSNPNLQNMPSRDSEWAPKCRALFVPEEGHLFGSIDYSQIEYRVLCHFAIGRGATEVQDAFNKTPDMDIHQWCADITGISRSQAKNINFGIIYGQGAKKTAAVLGLSLDEAKTFLTRFNDKMPFAKYTATEAMIRAERRGWVKTILGRRRRFNLYEPSEYSENRVDALTYDEAINKWGRNIKRARTYKALNAIVQGSSADLLKLAMMTAYEKGIFNTLVPLTTVHDELNVSVPQTKEGTEAFNELVHIMQTCYSFRVPILAEPGLGQNWSDAKYG